jgi:excisionase family DNA binding protein
MPSSSPVAAVLHFSAPVPINPEAPTMTRKTILKPGDLLDVWELCDLLGITEGSGRRLIRDGVIPVVKLGPKHKSRIGIRRADVEALIEANYKPATSGPLAK